LINPGLVCSRKRFFANYITYGNGLNAKIYANGVLDNTGTVGSTLGVNSDPLYIGGNHGDLAGFYYFNGRLARARVWSRELIASEIWDDYLFVAPPTTNLILHMDLDNSLTDLSTQSNNGTFGGSAGFSNGDVPQVKDTILRPANPANEEKLYPAGFIGSSLPAQINAEGILTNRGEYPMRNMQFTVGATVMKWKNNGLYEVSTGVQKYYLQDDVFVLI